ncbi:MAG: hypothetical protein HZA54_20040 [Planctomycetes bacterium]|nr:hypothetical protein [Planctomycetota bacterium]
MADGAERERAVGAAGAELRARVVETLRRAAGVLVGVPAIVYRGTYTGRGIVGANETRDAAGADGRGYVPVEWWVMSVTAAANPVPLPGEGLTAVRLADGGTVALAELRGPCADLVFGGAAARWPLLKLLDIGGKPVALPGRAPEVPPIPPHVHAGEIVNGRAVGPGKLEAYFFPPVDVPPYSRALGAVKTRLGLRAGVGRDEVLRALPRFGAGEEMYDLMNEYAIAPYDSWTIRPAVLHAPGPWPTVEIQAPQDDFNLAAWQYGARPDAAGRAGLYRDLCLRGLPDERAFLAEVVDWETSTRPDFRAAFYRAAAVLEEGRWGVRRQIFTGAFYGELVEVRPGERYRRPAGAEPAAGLLWSGRAEVNGTALADGDLARREFLLAPGHGLEAVNPGDGPLLLFLLYPIRPSGV